VSANTSAYDGFGSASPQWWPSRYGPDDQRGAGNELTPERTMAALRLPTRGEVIELAPVMTADMPGPAGRAWNQLILADGALEQHTDDVSQWSGFEEFVTHSYHVGCHVDGLCHNGIAGRAYNGWHYTDFFARTGVTKLGAENMRPWVTRGVCLDIAAIVGEEMLESGFAVTPAHAEQACERQGVTVGPGDAVLLHTGWMSLWNEDTERFLSGEPGCGWDLAHWLTDRRVSLLGADNWAFEVIPFEIPSRAFVVHQHLLAETGTYILENVRTSDLVAGDHSEFLFLLSPIKGKGSTGALAAPLAIV
jgi:kynurenine formamidase